jgi:hypothetical protein
MLLRLEIYKMVTAQELAEWYRLSYELKLMKVKENELRAKIFGFYFPNPKEGTNKFELKDGTGAVLKAIHVINRSVEPGSLDALKAALHEEGSPQLPIADLIRYKPELAVGEYRKLTAEEALFFDQCLIIKPGSPSLEITIPKKAKA